MKAPSNGFEEGKVVSAELWHACAGPLVNVPPIGSLVVYFPQGHSEQVAASMQKEIDSIPSYPNLPSKLVCMLHNVTLHADLETDEVYAQMTLQPVNKFDRDALLASEMALKHSRQPTEFFCKTLTASDTSTHGGFSVPRRAAEKIFPPLDFSMLPPAQEIVAKDLHGHAWTFRHIYRGQPKRHLLTTGWSVFVSSKRLFAGDSVLFIRDEKSQLLLGVRRVNRQQPALASSVISSDSMHIGILAAAAHAAANNSPFTIFYNPRASPTEFVVPFAKYNKAMYTQVSLGMRFRMIFETEECGVRRYMGTVTGITDVDSLRWKGSQWRNLQVGWDESTAGDRPSRVSVWDIEPVVTPFYICPPPFFRPKFPHQPGLPDEGFDMESLFKRGMPWLGDEFGVKDNSLFPGLSLVQWMSMQQNNQFPAAQSAFLQGKLLNFQSPNHPCNKTASQETQTTQFQQQFTALSQNQGLQNPLSSPQNPQPQKQQLEPQQQQIPQSNFVSNGIVVPTQNLSQNSTYFQQQLSGGNNQAQQNHPFNNDSVQIIPELQFHQQTVHQGIPLQRIQQHQETQIQQSRNLLPPLCPQVPSQVTTTQNLITQQMGANDITTSYSLTHSPEVPAVQFQDNNNSQCRSHLSRVWGDSTITAIPEEPAVQFQGIQKTAGLVRSRSCPNNVDPPPSCSTNNFQINMVQNLKDKSSNARTIPTSKVVEPQRFSVSSSYGSDTNALQQNVATPNFVSENVPISTTTMDVTPDTLIFNSGKEFNNMFLNYNGDMEAELSAMNSESFRVPNIHYKTGSSNDVQINEPAVLSGAIWPTQAPRIRTYTKVQKRGSVGRCIDVTRYKGYDDLRRDLARMFGIEGQLEDTHRREWKLVYVDHEGDILLVGDDPWDEFVNCVQGIKILSTVEVQQMSLDGDLGGNVPILPNQASSGTDSGNLWRGQYEDNSAASFNR